MNLIDRYVYAVVRNLPGKQRKDIEQELRGLIEDMLQRRTNGRTPEAADIEAVLLELGNPRKLADNYRGSARYLIGPAFFEIYWLVLRIVLGAVVLGVTIAFVVVAFAKPPDSAWQLAGNYLSSIWDALLSAFATVTLIFAVNEFFNQQFAAQVSQKLDEWKPADLPPVPTATSVAKRGDSIAALVFTVLFLLLVNIDIQLIGLYIGNASSMEIIPLFSDRFGIYLPWINLSLGLVVVLESAKLILGRWNWPILLGSIVQKVVGLLVGLRLIADPAIFNPGFFTRLQEIFSLEGISWPADLPAQIARVVVIVIIVGFAIDMLALLWKAIRLLSDRRV